MQFTELKQELINKAKELIPIASVTRIPGYEPDALENVETEILFTFESREAFENHENLSEFEDLVLHYIEEHNIYSCSCYNH